MNRRERRAAARASLRKDLAAQLRAMATNPLVVGDDRVKLLGAARQLDKGIRPLWVMARVEPILARLTGEQDRP